LTENNNTSIAMREYAITALNAAGSQVQVTLTPVTGASSSFEVWLTKDAARSVRLTIGDRVRMTLEFTGEQA
jgi:hypothetical protein